MGANDHTRAPLDPVVVSMMKLQDALKARGVCFNAINWTQGHVDLAMAYEDVDRLAEALSAHYVPDSRPRVPGVLTVDETARAACTSCRHRPGVIAWDGELLCSDCYRDARDDR